MTYEDYQELPDDQDYEIIAGVLYVAPSPRPRRQIVVYRFMLIVGAFVEERGVGTLIPDAGLIITDRDTYVSPDIMFIRRDRLKGVDLDEQMQIIPDLVVEVLSPTSQDYDRVAKRHTYAQLGIPHYWIIDPERRAITEHTLNPGGNYGENVHHGPAPFTPSMFPDLTVDLTNLFG